MQETKLLKEFGSFKRKKSSKFVEVLQQYKLFFVHH